MKRTPAKKTADPFAERLSPQLATLVSAPPTRGEWVYEIKLDGYRILARCEGGKAPLHAQWQRLDVEDGEPCARDCDAPRSNRMA